MKIFKNILVHFLIFFTSLLILFIVPPVISIKELTSDLKIWEFKSLSSVIFWQIRMPKLVLAYLTGAALSVSGVAFQAFLNNPLADPYILGISGGAALGYVLAIILGVPFSLVALCAFISSLLSLSLIYKMSFKSKTLDSHQLLLLGVVFNSFSFAVILVVNTLVPFGQAHQILNLLLGSIEPVSIYKISIFATLLFACGFILIAKAPGLNLLSLGSEHSQTLGLDTVKMKQILFVTGSILVGASVSLCGLI
jgi:iron complex transport system permease protein